MIPTRNISTTVVADGLVKEEAVACRRQNNREIERLRANVKESTENTEMVMKMSGEMGGRRYLFLSATQILLGLMIQVC